ncbi:hypothetical protein EVAR_50120_1, partial [Eumeta japonica]
MPQPSEDHLKNVSLDFEEMWNFPNCIGSLDGKHCRVKRPRKSGSAYYNYKHYFSIVLQAVADAKKRFITIEVGGRGKQSDGGTFSASFLNRLLERATSSNWLNSPDVASESRAPPLVQREHTQTSHPFDIAASAPRGETITNQCEIEGPAESTTPPHCDREARRDTNTLKAPEEDDEIKPEESGIIVASPCQVQNPTGSLEQSSCNGNLIQETNALQGSEDEKKEKKKKKQK